MNVLPAFTQGEPSDLPPQAPAAAHAALLRLVWLAIYVAVMRALGYRFRRLRSQRPSGPPHPPVQNPAVRPQPQPQPQPRRDHLYFDRDTLVSALASINSDHAAAQGGPAPAERSPTLASPPIAEHPQAAQPASCAPRRPAIIPSPHPATRPAPTRSVRTRLTTRPHPPPFSKPRWITAPTLAYFVTI